LNSRHFDRPACVRSRLSERIRHAPPARSGNASKCRPNRSIAVVPANRRHPIRRARLPSAPQEPIRTMRRPAALRSKTGRQVRSCRKKNPRRRPVSNALDLYGCASGLRHPCTHRVHTSYRWPHHDRPRSRRTNLQIFHPHRRVASRSPRLPAPCRGMSRASAHSQIEAAPLPTSPNPQL